MKGRFVINIHGRLKVYDDTDKIPMVFDNLVEYAPDIPPSPHTQEEHDILYSMKKVLKELMKRERR